MTNFNQKRAEKPFLKEVQILVMKQWILKVKSINEDTPIAEQQKNVEMKDTLKARLEDEVKEKQECPFLQQDSYYR